MTADLRLNVPRYAVLKNIMAAKKKPLDTKTPQDLGVDIAPRQGAPLTMRTPPLPSNPHLPAETLGVEEPAARKAGVKVADVDALIDKLRNEAKVL